MRIVVQRVISSQVEVNEQVISKIGQGLNLLVGIKDTDTEEQVDWMVKKCLQLRLFSDRETDKPWQKSIVDIQGEILVVSQFTLYGDCRKGRKPSFSDSARPETAQMLYNLFVQKLRATGLKIETGQFGAMMQVSIVNDGPVTIILERDSTQAQG